MIHENPFSSDWLRQDRDDGRRPQGGVSYVSGATAEPLRFTTIPALLEQAVSRFGGGDAAIFAAGGDVGARGERVSWDALMRRSDEVAAGLLALGIEKGDRVGLWAPNCLEWLLVQFGTARIGAILVNINPAYRAAELEFALKKTQCRVLVMAKALKSSDYIEIVTSLAPEIASAKSEEPLLLANFPSLEHLVLIGGEAGQPGMVSFNALLKLAGPAQKSRLAGLSAALDPDDAINIQFTSGTTGQPKGATLSHFNIINNAQDSAKCMNISEQDRLCIPVPLYHIFGMVIGVLVCAATGATMVFPGESFEAGETLHAVQQYRCTALHGVPAMFLAQLEHPDFAHFDLSSLRTGIMAGSPCPIATMRRVIADMHMTEITIAYGMTETGPLSFQSDVGDSLERRVTTVGRVMPHVEVKIIDKHSRIVPTGAQGELCTRGYSVMLGYWDDTDATREAIDAAAWLHTGDLATLDAEGFCNIVGRVKEMVIRGGENIFPAEIEEYLYLHPKVMEVQVFGVPDPRVGEEVCAWITLKAGMTATEEEIRDFCKGRIAHFKVPRYVRFVAEIPTTVTGKAQKFVMRQKMIDELGLSETKTA